jgi:hypothetical protein
MQLLLMLLLVLLLLTMLLLSHVVYAEWEAAVTFTGAEPRTRRIALKWRKWRCVG